MFTAIATLAGQTGGDAVMSEIEKQFPFGAFPKGPIWENKIYRDRPQLARGEGAITEFRAWARQSSEEAHP
jgi:hypothetical protein